MFPQAFGGADYSFLSTTTSTPDSVHTIKKDLTQQSNQLLSQQSTPSFSSSGMKKKKSVVNLFTCNQPQQSSPSSKNLPEQNQLTQSSQNLCSQQQSNPSSLCDTSPSSSNILTSKQFSAFNNISFDTNLDFLSFVSLYRSFR